MERRSSLLYDAGGVPLSKKREPAPKEKQRIAQDYYDYWFDSAEGFFKLYLYSMENKDHNKAAFCLHQCAECRFPKYPTGRNAKTDIGVSGPKVGIGRR